MLGSNKRKIAVLGAGISGLSTAHAFKKGGFDVTVYEKNAKPGGVIQTRKENGWLVEAGPNTVMVKEKKLWNFFEELNLTDQIVEANKQSKKRFIVRDRKLHPVPASLSRFLTTPLLSARAKLRWLKEPFVDSPHKKDESLASFITRRFGKELLDYGVNPLIAGIYAGDPSNLSAKHTFPSLTALEQEYGSVFRGLVQKKKGKTAKKALVSFHEGLHVLIDRLRDELDESLLLNTEVTQVNKNDDKWTVKTNGGRQEYAHIVSTIPPRQLSGIWGETHSRQAINKLTNIEYAPVSVLVLGFKQKQIDHPLDGFGFLVPEKENFNLLGCLFSSSLFPNRAPGNHALLTCFIGGSRNPGLAAQPADKLIPTALDDLDQLLGIEGKPVFSRHIYWARAIPQFNVGYDQYLNAAAEIEKKNPGFFIGGNFISGVSVPDCIQSSFEMAERKRST